MAAREIDRVGGHPGFVQVFLPVALGAALRQARYHPIYEAAVRHDLVVGLHFGGAPGNPPTSAAGRRTTSRSTPAWPRSSRRQLMSLIVEGVFDRFPTLRVALIESGFSLAAALHVAARQGVEGAAARDPLDDAAALGVRPRARALHARSRSTRRPTRRRLLQLIDQFGSDELLMFSTDYPHWHFDAPEEALPAGLPDDLAPQDHGRERARLLPALMRDDAIRHDEARPMQS